MFIVISFTHELKYRENEFLLVLFHKEVYDDADQLVAAHPATIGSEDTPSPEGQHNVVAIAKNPTYTYDPKKLNFENIQTKEKFTIAPGPNNPVGLVWIALDVPGYGIHGSPNPSKIRRKTRVGVCD